VHIEPRWPVVLAIVVVFSLLTLLPGRVRVFPIWVPYLDLATTALVVPMAALWLATDKARWLRIENVVVLLALVVAGFGIIDQLTLLLFEMVRRSNEVTGLQLLTSSIALWATNVLVFSLAYWRLDRGGPLGSREPREHEAGLAISSRHCAGGRAARLVSDIH